MVVEQVASYIGALKKSGTPGRQIDTLERLVRENQAPASTPAPASANTSNIPTPASSAPTSPGLHVDINSAAPTPNLTMDPNSPLSSPSSNHPPYLNGDPIAEIPVVDQRNGQMGGKESDWEDVED
jgi:mRNA-binding protein PUF3